MRYLTNPHWYVLRIRSNYDEHVQKGLTSKEFEFLYPTYQEKSKRKDRKKLLTKPVFHGYCFVHVQLTPASHLEILKTHGVIDFLKNTNGPLPVEENEINNVRHILDYIGQLQQQPRLKKGLRVQIIQGPLTGLTGVIDSIKDPWIQIHVDPIPGAITLEVNPDDLQLLEDENYS